MRHGPIVRRFGPSYVYPVYFLRKSTKFHDIGIDGKIILIHFLLIIYHKSLDIAKRCPLPYFLPIFSPKSLSLWLISGLSTVIGGDDLHKEERGDMMLVVVPIEDRGDIMIVVFRTLVLN